MGPWENCCVQTLLMAGAGGHLEETRMLPRHPAIASSRVRAEPVSGDGALRVLNSRGHGI
jgi:hypothetical protein